MVYKNYLEIILKWISALTIVSGLVQILAPGFVLNMIGGEINDSTMYMFGIIGMFMMLFGGLLLQALFSKKDHPVAVLWCALQKFGAGVAVTLAVGSGLFSLLALGVALFDLFSGVLIAIYWYSISKKESTL
ncbi:patatin [Rhodohalobacter barkolensis]|uniref:Patatin n=1 Tax=Rhodohalobacter barkolensis TaxID=2053187 RepID=A0A2N0VJE2_9BACT|nr:patatin [Rhodohalobacter barkolensis]PKD44268.1 patatin [Rhodohalobacter barkolensis]